MCWVEYGPMLGSVRKVLVQMVKFDVFIAQIPQSEFHYLGGGCVATCVPIELIKGQRHRGDSQSEDETTRLVYAAYGVDMFCVYDSKPFIDECDDDKLLYSKSLDEAEFDDEYDCMEVGQGIDWSAFDGWGPIAHCVASIHAANVLNISYLDELSL